MGSDREQDLAQTATAAASATCGAVEPVGATLGRYRLERELGAGGMGVVHAAFDPDLERRVAIKVLRVATATVEAKDRLMREARAMARLTHPNVVTVHEVGTADGRDFVAMELIRGETLAEWLRAKQRSAAAIVDAFVAAGRGLAAAHAAGIVHRDFKPHNVLRSRDGRIVVTDFGLAREAQDALPALDTTLPIGRTGVSTALAGITVTGSLLGTPAYMAPEQWQGGAVTPATDQFAYCVALWEALAGERPYRGPTFDELRAQITSGPAALDASRIPRRLRRLLRRGLDPDPDRRWPSMDALLARLVRARRRPGAAIAIAGGALAAAVVAYLALRPGAAAPGCEPPAREVAAVWSPVIDAQMRVQTSAAHAAVLEAAHHDWQVARAAACTASPQVRQAQLQCLDGVFGRFDALRQAFARIPDVAAEELQAQLIDPAICNKPTAPDVPRITLAPTPDVIAAYALHARSQAEHKPSDAEIAALTDAARADPCARVIATLAFDDASKDIPRARSLMSNAVSLADQCGDDRLRAELLIRSVPYLRERPIIGPKGEAALRNAEVAANRVSQPDLAAAVAEQRFAALQPQRSWDELLRLIDIEIAGYGARGLTVRQLQSAITRNQTRLSRRTPSDIDAVASDVATWRPIALASHRADLVWQLDFLQAITRFARGDIASAHPDLVRLWQTRPPSGRALSPRTIEGDVVDERGRPAPGASVAAGFSLLADAIGIGVPQEDDGTLRITTTDAAGHFVLRDIPVPTGAIAAQLGDRRSPAAEIADRVKLVLAPTRGVSGNVALHGVPATQVTVFGEPDGATARSRTIALVATDGSFSLSGMPLGTVRVGVVVRESPSERVEYEAVVPASQPAGDLALTVAAPTRSLDVVVRSSVAAPLDGAGVFVLYGKQQIKNIGELMRLPSLGGRELLATPVAEGSIPAPLAHTVRRGDLLAHIEHLGAGTLTVCAVSFPGDMLDPVVQQRMMTHLKQFAITCKLTGPDTTVAVLSAAPQQSLD